MKTDKQLLAMAMEALDYIMCTTEDGSLLPYHRLNEIKGRAKRMIEYIKKHQDEEGGH